MAIDVEDALIDSRMAAKSLVIMDLEDDTRDDLLAWGMRRTPDGSARSGLSDPSQRWLDSLGSEADRDARRRDLQRSVAVGSRICRGIGEVFGPLVERALREYYVRGASTWAEAFEAAGMRPSSGYMARTAALEWAESVGLRNAISGTGIAEGGAGDDD